MLLFLLAPISLAACRYPSGESNSEVALSADLAQVARAVLIDYRVRFSADACLAPVTIGRSGVEEIPHDLADRKIVWTYLMHSKGGTYEKLDAEGAAVLDQAWQVMRTGNYPDATLPAAAFPRRPVEGCGTTLTLTSPMIVGINAFVRWTDGTNRRTMALHKYKSGWSVVAEGSARIG